MHVRCKKNCVMCKRIRLHDTFKMQNLIGALLGLPLPIDLIAYVCRLVCQVDREKVFYLTHYRFVSYTPVKEKIEMDLY